MNKSRDNYNVNFKTDNKNIDRAIIGGDRIWNNDHILYTSKVTYGYYHSLNGDTLDQINAPIKITMI